jgi:hypothetical protein
MHAHDVQAMQARVLLDLQRRLAEAQVMRRAKARDSGARKQRKDCQGEK